MRLKKSAARATSTSRSSANVIPLRDTPATKPSEGHGVTAQFAKLFRKIDDRRFEADLLGADRVLVELSPEVDVELADRCLADQDIVLVGVIGSHTVMFGALRTRERRPDEVIIEAPKKLVLRAGKSRLELRADGKVKLSGDDVTVDAPHEVRLASAHVELP